MRLLLLSIFALTVAAACTDHSADARTQMELTAPGMHCDGCVATVEETLMKMDGVDSVHADLDSKRVYVLVDTARSSRTALNHMIEQLGFAEAREEE